MTAIVESHYVEGTSQKDGRVPIKEVHTDDLGRPLSFEYLLSEGMDPNVILASRAARLNTDFAVKDAEIAEAAKGKIPWSKLEFRDQLGQQAEFAMDAFFASFETNTLLSDMQKAMIRTGYNRYKESHYIERPLKSEVLVLLGLLNVLGLITQEKIAEIQAASEV